jgi:hypothetical protein
VMGVSEGPTMRECRPKAANSLPKPSGITGMMLLKE